MSTKKEDQIEELEDELKTYKKSIINLVTMEGINFKDAEYILHHEKTLRRKIKELKESE